MSGSFVSTRDPEQRRYSYAEALLRGLAPDGGLLTPADIPKISDADLLKLPNDYPALATEITAHFIGESDIKRSALKGIYEEAYSQENFVRSPDHEPGIVTPVDQIADTLFVQNLSLGPTAAFKDMALQPLGRQMTHVLERLGKKIRIVGATSGDTGSAAINPFVGSDRATVFMLSPHERMSRFQWAQMGIQSGGNIHNLSIRGTFDDCQDLVKELKLRDGFSDIGAVNSINIGRPLAQIAYYFSGYQQVMQGRMGQEVDFVVPTGNFGNAYAGHMARRMGLPIRNILIATNENDILHTAVQTGLYKRRESEATSSPSMDISVSSNLERLIFEMLEYDPVRTAKLMEAFKKDGQVKFPSPDSMSTMGFESGRSTAEDRLDSIRWVYQVTEQKRVIDPHTADGVTVARQYIDSGRSDGVPVIVLETALPVKFEDTIQQALGFVPERPARFRGLEERVPKDAFTIIDPDIDQLAEYVSSNSAT